MTSDDKPGAVYCKSTGLSKSYAIALDILDQIDYREETCAKE